MFKMCITFFNTNIGRLRMATTASNATSVSFKTKTFLLMNVKFFL